MRGKDLQQNIDFIMDGIGRKSPITVKRILIGKEEIDAAILYVEGLINKDVVDRDLLNSLLFHADEGLGYRKNMCDYICKKYLPLSSSIVEKDIYKVIEALKIGKTAIIIDGVNEFIIADTAAGAQRAPADPINESAIRGPRLGFNEDIKTNISILRKYIKDKNMAVESFKVGRRSQTDGALVYIEDIVDKDLLNEIKSRISLVDVDNISSADTLVQYIESYSYTVFPQSYGTERPDTIVSNIMEGRIAILINGSPSVFTVPALFIEFFQGVEDYYGRTVVSSFSRILRFIAIFLVITFSSIYLTLLKFNAELIPINFITPIVQSRAGIALTPFMEILVLEIIVEVLREGGLRLPSKIAQTMSVVGGIIIGDTAVRSKIVSPTTLLIIGITVVASFVIPSYHMSLVIRFLRFPMLIMANTMGIFGIAIGWFVLLVHLSSLESFGVPYFSLTKQDLMDFVVRAPLWQMNKRPTGIPKNDVTRQTDFRMFFGRMGDGQEKE